MQPQKQPVLLVDGQLPLRLRNCRYATRSMYLKDLRESKPAAGHDRVMYAGLPEHEEKIEREEKGIPYHPEVIEWFHGICKELDIPWRLTASN